MTYKQGYQDALKAAADAICPDVQPRYAPALRRMATINREIAEVHRDAILALPIPDHASDEHKCSDPPDAPHGFLRSASHTAGRYVCECEGWVPPDGFVVVHATPAIDEECDHSWVGEDGKDYENPDHCSKCGLSFTRYIHCCCF